MVYTGEWGTVIGAWQVIQGPELLHCAAQCNREDACVSENNVHVALTGLTYRKGVQLH